MTIEKRAWWACAVFLALLTLTATHAFTQFTLAALTGFQVFQALAEDSPDGA
jgi:hypothetical protein